MHMAHAQFCSFSFGGSKLPCEIHQKCIHCKIYVDVYRFCNTHNPASMSSPPIHLLETTRIQLHHIMLYLYISIPTGTAYLQCIYQENICISSYYSYSEKSSPCKKTYIYLTGSSFYWLIFIPVKR